MTDDDGAPEWFRRAIEAPAEESALTVEGCRIAFRRWGEPDKPAVVLVHGGGAHSRWWDHIGPLLATEYCAVALDLSGHGDSGRRPAYSFDTWAQEILAVAGAGAGSEPPVVVGHSMGGKATMQAAALAGSRLRGIIIVDSPVEAATSPEEEQAGRRSAFGPLRLYPTVEAALERFHTVPDQPGSLPYVIDHVARVSLRPADGGWTWKFDPNFTVRGGQVEPATLSRITCRVALLRAEHGLVTPDIGSFMYEQLGRTAPVVEIPAANHHVMLDQPLSLVTAVRTLLADWRHSSAVRRRPG